MILHGQFSRALLLGYVVLVMASHGDARAQSLTPSAPAANAPVCGIEAGSIVDRLRIAMATRKSSAIAKVMADLRASGSTPDVSLATRFRRPYKRDYRRILSDAQLSRIARRTVDYYAAQPWMRRTDGRPTTRRADRLMMNADGVRSLSAIASAFPQLRDRALSVAERAADGLIAASKASGSPSLPLPFSNQGRGAKQLPILALVSNTETQSCEVSSTAAKNGWLFLESRPDLFYKGTGLAGVALVELTRETRKPRFRAWADGASQWAATRDFAPQFHRNAYIALMEAELYLYTSNKRHLSRAIERIVIGVLPGFGNGGPRAGRWMTPASDSFDARLLMTRVLLKTVIAIAAAPSGDVEPKLRETVERAAHAAYLEIETELKRGRGVVAPGALIELFLDIETARRAGANFKSPSSNLLEMTLATGVRKISKGLLMEGASNGRLLAALKERAFSGRHRPAVKR